MSTLFEIWDALVGFAWVLSIVAVIGFALFAAGAFVFAVVSDLIKGRRAADGDPQAPAHAHEPS